MFKSKQNFTNLTKRISWLVGESRGICKALQDRRDRMAGTWHHRVSPEWVKRPQADCRGNAQGFLAIWYVWQKCLIFPCFQVINRATFTTRRPYVYVFIVLGKENKHVRAWWKLGWHFCRHRRSSSQPIASRMARLKLNFFFCMHDCCGYCIQCGGNYEIFQISVDVSTTASTFCWKEKKKSARAY